MEAASGALKKVSGGSELDVGKLQPNVVERVFMKRMEQQNVKRVNRLVWMSKKNLWTLSAIGVGIAGIYFMTMHQVGQEDLTLDAGKKS